MGIDIQGIYLVLGGRQEGGADSGYVRRRHLGGERIYAATPGKSRHLPILVDFDLSHLAWQDDANCRDTDPEVFFPTIGQPTDPMVRSICQACPVQGTCLEYAMERPQLVGVWGGLNDEERRAARKKANAEKRQPQRHAAP